MIDIPEFLPLKITQSQDLPQRKSIDALDQLIAILPEQPGKTHFRALLKSAQM